MPAWQAPRELDPLGFAARERGRALPEFDVIQPDPGERFELGVDRGDVREVLHRLFDAHVEHIGDRLSFVQHFQGLAVVPLPFALLTLDVDIGEEVHLDLDEAVALARLAPGRPGC